MIGGNRLASGCPKGGEGIEKSWSKVGLGTESQRNAASVCSGACASGGPGLLRERPLAQTGASGFAAELLRLGVALRGWSGAHAHCRARARGLHTPAQRVAGGRAGPPACPRTRGIVGYWRTEPGGGGPEADCKGPGPRRFGEGGGGGSGPRLPSAVAQHCGLLGPRSRTPFLTSPCFLAGRRAG